MTFRGSDIEIGSWDSRLLVSCATRHKRLLPITQRHGRSASVLTNQQAVVSGFGLTETPKHNVKTATQKGHGAGKSQGDSFSCKSQIMQNADRIVASHGKVGRPASLFACCPRARVFIIFIIECNITRL